MIRHLSFTTALCLLSITPLTAAPDLPPEKTKQLEESFATNAAKPGAALFTPPPNWQVADSSILPETVLVMVVGKSTSAFPPSINLGAEHFSGTVKQYLKRVKELNQAQGFEWKDLGSIKTEAGDVSLSQVDRKNEWGEIRMMHLITKKNDTIYILTAASLKEEFPRYYNDFFSVFRSFRFNKTAHEMVTDKVQRVRIEKDEVALKTLWKAVYAENKAKDPTLTPQQLNEQTFNSKKFEEMWNRFKSMLENNYSNMGVDWRNALLGETHSVLESLTN